MNAQTRYDLTIQWTDTSREPGYQETSEHRSVAATSVEAAIKAARALRPSVTRVQVHGIVGTGVAFDTGADPSVVWSA